MSMRTLPCLCLLLTLVSCHQQPKRAENTRQNYLRLNLRVDPAAFDPRQVRTLRDLTLMKQLYEGLMRLDSEGIPQPAIARGVIASDDSLHYTFFLRETTWNTGEALTAHDFVRSWTQAQSSDFPCDYAYILDMVERVTALDDLTLEVILNKPTPYFLELMAFPTYFPVHREERVTNGPFQLEEWRPQSELILQKNPTYWDEASVELSGIIFLMIEDNNTESHLFDKGELDWLGQPISHNIATELLANSSEQQSYDIAGTYWLRFNTTRAPFDDIRVRRALAFAIDRQQIITHILQGGQAVATGPVPPSMRLSEAPYFLDHHLSRARQLLQEAFEAHGWESLPKITFSHPPTERTSKIVQLIQQQWREGLGVEVELRALEEKVYRQRVVEGDYHVGTGEWIADFNDPLAFLEIFKYSDSINATGWESSSYIALLEASLAEPSRRRDLLRQAEELLISEMPIIPLYHYAFDYFKNPNVSGVVLSPLGTADFKHAHIR